MHTVGVIWCDSDCVQAYAHYMSSYSTSQLCLVAAVLLNAIYGENILFCWWRTQCVWIRYMATCNDGTAVIIICHNGLERIKDNWSMVSVHSGGYILDTIL